MDLEEKRGLADKNLAVVEDHVLNTNKETKGKGKYVTTTTRETETLSESTIRTTSPPYSPKLSAQPQR
jgi:hypothetical protein